MKALGLVLTLGIVAGFFGLFYFVVLNPTVPDCPGHWHATFAVFVPDEQGNPKRVDYTIPRAPNGAEYDDLKGAAGMGVGLHMHQSGSEKGSNVLGPAQLHLEAEGQCVGVGTALSGVDVKAGSDSLKLQGGLGQLHLPQMSFSNHGDDRARYWLQTYEHGNWTWHEESWSNVNHHVLRDGESTLAAFGHYSDSQVRGMQAQVPAPMSRLHPEDVAAQPVTSTQESAVATGTSTQPPPNRTR